ncbi:MAG: hypothetical protein L6R43_11300 [Planctomycetes bacterium]|nr:hypothetical protein [Planctomycetota bacterium]
MLRYRSAVSVAAAAAALLAACAGAFAGDFVQKKDGSFQPPLKSQTPGAQDYASSTWSITEADINEIKYTLVLNNKPIVQKMPAQEVTEIWLAPERFPKDWKDASDRLASGDYNGAFGLFKAIGDAKQVHQVVRQKALLAAARSMAAADAGPKVDEAYDYMLKAFPATFYARSAWKDRANYWMDKGDEAKALDALKKLLLLPGVSDGDKMEARLLQNTVSMRKAVVAKDAAALQKCHDEYKAIAAETSGRKELVDVNRMARLGMASALLELNNPKEAKSLFQEIADTAQDNGVLAAAFNGLGECWFRQGTPEAFAEARLCFLRTVTMYSEGASAEQVAKALCFAGECFWKLSSEEGSSANARKEFDDCIRRFPNSPWAKKARQLKLNIK